MFTSFRQFTQDDRACRNNVSRLRNASYILICATLAFVSSAKADVIIDASLQAYWNAENLAVDVTGNGHDGTFQGNTAVVPGSPFGNAFSFDGLGDYIDIGDELDMGTSNFTLSAWVKGDPAMNQWARILDKGYASAYELGRTSFASTIGFTFLNSDPSFTSTSSLIDNTWHHVAVVKSGTTATVYADGVGQNTVTVSSASQDNALPLLIGYNPGEGQAGAWKGQLDELAIYNRALSPLEIGTLAAGSTGGDSLSFPDFSNTPGLQMSGNAAQVGNVIRLSTASPYNAGTVFTTSPVRLGVGNSFSTQFQFRITNSGGLSDEDGVGADGLVFVLQRGTTGSSIGYGNPSLGIEFDTYNNGAPFGDPNGNHVGVDLNASIVSVQTQNEPVRFNNGQVWNAWVDFNGTTDQLEVRWSTSTVKPVSAQLSRTIDLMALLGQDIAYAGFTSATGGGWGDHDLLSWVATTGLTALASRPGDYNDDELVDVADYILWRKNQNSSAALTNDTTPGSVTNLDYAVWRSNFGESTGSSASAAAIPEPTTIAILIVAFCLAATRAPRRWSKKRASRDDLTLLNRPA